MYERSSECIYSMVSKRVKVRIKNMGKLREEVIPTNPERVSYITSNKREKNKNPYLMSEDNAEFIKENLIFNSVNSIYWGDHWEIELFAGDFFLQLIEDIYESENVVYKEIIDDVLVDYVPFGKLLGILGASKIIEEENYESSAIHTFFVETNKKYFSNDVYIKTRKEALGRFFGRIKREFITKFTLYFYKKRLLKLPKIISEFVETEIIPMLEVYRADESSLGKRIYNIAEKDIRYGYTSSVLTGSRPPLSEDTISLGSGEFYDELYQELWFSSEVYIDKLTKLQLRMDGTAIQNKYYEVLENKWTYDKYYQNT